MAGEVFQLGFVSRQQHDQTGTVGSGFALELVQQTAGYAPHAGDLAYAQVADLPFGVALAQNRCAQQALVKAGSDQVALFQVMLQQVCGAAVGRQQPVRGFGVNFFKIDCVLAAGQLDLFQKDRHGRSCVGVWQ